MERERVIFLCTGNSARSQMAEALLRRAAGDRFEVYSAGLKPKGIHPLTRQVLAEIGCDMAGQRSKGLDEYLGRLSFTFLITLCGNAEETCPVFPGVGQRLYWPFDDPAAAEGSDAEKLAAFRRVRDAIAARIQAWLAAAPSLQSTGEYALEARDLSIYYGRFRALKGINVSVQPRKITAFIGPSGCGKSTLLRAFNRMNDLVPGARLEGQVLYQGTDIYARDIDPVEVRRRVGMVFQRPNPFPKSIYENVAWGARINGIRGSMDELVERSLRQAALWDEVKDKLHQSGLSLSGGQQQRLCIARTIALKSDTILMDEPASALDPIATLKIEELMRDLAQDYTILIVTHNMQQAARISDYTAFLMMDPDRAGTLVEYGATRQLFTRPKDKRTEDYITGRFG